MANLDERKKEIASLISKAQEAVEKGDLETARNLKADIDAKKKEFEELEQLSQEIEASAPKLEETPPQSEGAEETDNKAAEEKEDTSVDDAKGEEKSDDKPSNDDKPSSEEKLEPPAIEKVEEPTEEEKDKKKKEGAKRSMAKLNQNPETNEEVLAFEQYMKSKGAKRDNVKSDDVGVTIPEDIKYIPEKEVKTVQDLSELVQKTSVSTASGKYPILKRANAKFNTVAELEKNPELARPEFETITWEVDTYRGAIPISQEALDDSVANLTAIVSENINEQKINTLNERIGEVLKAFNPTSVSNVDDLKEIINVKLDPGYDRQIICTQSFYQKLDTLKDGNGRYLLQDSIINTAGNTVLGMNVTVVRDDLLGKNGDALAFIGDVKRGVLFADRTDISVQWIENEIYGKYLMGAFRFDVKQADKNAGFFVTFEDAAEPSGDLGA
ncbi:phage major capsid protein [Staphylococcus epidermidis]|jgi:HK97 family phage major capsid protein|uniref:major head protein n=1 Tax=Staphylococcus phage StB20-like TaxID=1732064 RepID=UPI00026BF04D|nr:MULTISPECIES: phage major capsid protein [Staphylococcus]YP_009200544.1 major head protein [Staphylococcus phage StB20-like]EON86880.1 putative capsid protein [Staphylococcus epidermidis 36-1]MDS6013318.1 phage major capsid protein [Streptococcus pneumoniae]MDU4769984.1 phage major capsid protein [Staphylococcus lugdunensis]MDU7414475.1 phage major capsid protein [Varibaculum cambriense]SLC55506.1 Predicted phage phi-C31 gp36 major capsid-like protein [Mycobacteroides abscessus subsp. mass